MALEEHIAEALIGDEAKRFIESDFGQTVMGIARQEAELCRLKYAKADPENAKAIREIQNEEWLAERFQGWVMELLTKGEEAMRAYKQQRDE